MITNREEVLENALRVFAKMNYEKASLVTIAKACGLSKWGLIYYYPFKQDLFNAVVEKYIFAMQDPGQKFSFEGGTLLEFIGHHVEGVERTMRRIVGLLDCAASWACWTTATTRRGAATTSTTSGVQLQLLLLPPADASAAVLPRRPSEVRRTV